MGTRSIVIDGRRSGGRGSIFRSQSQRELKVNRDRDSAKEGLGNNLWCRIGTYFMYQEKKQGIGPH